MADKGEETTTTTYATTTDARRNCCDFLWVVTTKEGLFKLAEAIMTFLTFVIVSSFPGSYKAEYEFLIFVATTAFVFTVLHIILRMTHLFEKLPSALTQPLIGLIACSLATLALLVGSAVVFAKGIDYHWATLEASGICGFIATVLFFLEAVYFFIRYRRAPKRQDVQRTAEDIRTGDYQESDELQKV